MTARDAATALGLSLKRAATDRQISQRQICAATGLKPTTVNRVLNGKYPANSENLCAIAQAIGVEIKVRSHT